MAHIDAVIEWATQQARAFWRLGIRALLHRLRPKWCHGCSGDGANAAPASSFRHADEGNGRGGLHDGTRQLFYARLPDVKGTAGSVAFVLDEVMPASPAYRWSVNHTVAVDHPMELFPVHLTEAGI